jgi:transposase InsO family protein
LYNAAFYSVIRDQLTTQADGEFAALSKEDEQMTHHRRAGHLSHSTLRVTNARGFDYLKQHFGFCDSCPAGNSRARNRTTKRTRETKLLGLVHMDLWGPAQVKGARDKCSYVCAFVDDASRLVAAYRIKKKSDTLAAYIEFKKRHAKPLQLNIRRIQTDNGTESMGDFIKYVENDGTVVQRSAPYSQSQNSVVERMFGTLFSMVRKMLADPQLPAKYWDYALSCAVWIKNRTSTRALENGITPFEVFWGKKPDLSYLRVFGSPVYVHVDASIRQKLDSRVIKCLFVGYSDSHKAWKCLDLKTGRELITITASFNERIHDKTPSLTLLQQEQPTDLKLWTLEEDAFNAHKVTSNDATKEQTPLQAPPKTPQTRQPPRSIDMSISPEKRGEQRSSMPGVVPVVGSPKSGELDEKFYRLPSDMNLIQIADHFQVDSHDYSRYYY